MNPHRATSATVSLAHAAAPEAGGAEEIYAELRNAIVDHRLAPGTKLREQEIATAFGVSRTLVREVLIRLSRDRLVVQQLNRSAEVARPEWSEARHLFAARELIEGHVARELAGRCDDTQLAAMRALMDEEAHAIADGDKADAIRLSGDFHLRLAGFAGNPVLSELLHGLVSRSSLLFALYHRAGEPMCVAHDHERLLTAIASGDGDAAEAEMRAHLAELEHHLHPQDEGTPPTLARLLGRKPATRRKAS